MVNREGRRIIYIEEGSRFSRIIPLHETVLRVEPCTVCGGGRVKGLKARLFWWLFQLAVGETWALWRNAEGQGREWKSEAKVVDELEATVL